MKKILVVLLVAILLAGCMTVEKNSKDSAIWFDNKSGETITCYVDGEMVSTVEPGKLVIYSLPSGDHEWEVRSENHYWHGTVGLRWGEIRNLAIEKPSS